MLSSALLLSTTVAALPNRSRVGAHPDIPEKPADSSAAVDTRQTHSLAASDNRGRPARHAPSSGETLFQAQAQAQADEGKTRTAEVRARREQTQDGHITRRTETPLPPKANTTPDTKPTRLSEAKTTDAIRAYARAQDTAPPPQLASDLTALVVVNAPRFSLDA